MTDPSDGRRMKGGRPASRGDSVDLHDERTELGLGIPRDHPSVKAGRLHGHSAIAGTDVVPGGTVMLSGAGTVTLGAVLGATAVSVEVAVVVSGIPVGSPLPVNENVSVVAVARYY